MPQYRAPLRDMQFVLHEVLDVERHYRKIPGLEGITRDTVDAVLSECGRFAQEVLSPLNSTGDAEGCTLVDGVVTTPRGFKEAYARFCENGTNSIAVREEYGGQGLPSSIMFAVGELNAGANMAFSMYPALSSAAMAAIEAHGTEQQKRVFLTKMAEGTWSGTMCLTEPQCGTDLGLIRTQAVPADDGSYQITGEKIFISAGEHDLTENIVHLVLARLPDAPKGTRGISLFLVPKLSVSEDGTLGKRNALRCAAIEHKMGIKASATCVMLFEGAKGYLVGEPHKGLRCMFTMMNVARIGTGMQGMALGELSLQAAVAYAKERVQMRSLTGPKAPDKPADPIIVHPDVRRMLLTQKAIVEGSRALVYYCATLNDLTRHAPETGAAKDAGELLDLLTPICKAFLTDLGLESTALGMQVFGGHGYIREQGMEQIARDVRVLPIYEGANGIQALDLLGRKVLATGGARLRPFTDEIEKFCASQTGDAELSEMVGTLRELCGEWHGLIARILGRAMTNPDEAGAASYDFMTYSGYVCFAYLFARMAAVSRNKLREGAEDRAFYEAKLETARFFYKRLLPRTRTLRETMVSGAEDLMRMPADSFGC